MSESSRSIQLDIPELNHWKTKLGWTNQDLANAGDVEKRTIERMYQFGRIGNQTYAAILERIQTSLIEKAERIGIAEPDYPVTLELQKSNLTEVDDQNIDGQTSDTLVEVGLRSIEINIPEEVIDKFSREKRDRILLAIRSILETDRTIDIRAYREGSVKMTIELSASEAERIMFAIDNDELIYAGITSATFIEELPIIDYSAAQMQLKHGEPETAALRQKVLLLARELFQHSPDWVTFFRETLGVSGCARSVFPRQVDYSAFESSQEFTEIQNMVACLRGGNPARASEATRVITVRLPASLHEALKQECIGRNTSMNKLCISKLLLALINEQG